MDKNIALTHEVVKDALDQMKGAVMIVYPMSLPPHDPVRQELENTEDLSGTQVRLKVTGKNKIIVTFFGKTYTNDISLNG